MNNSMPSELLSAYLDGEISERERAAVEDWLAQSVEARRQLEDFRRLSALIKELPPLSAPAEFAASVMQSAERRMLLPEPRAATRPVKRLATRFGALLGTAAAACVVIWLALPERPPAQLQTDRRPPARAAGQQHALASRAAGHGPERLDDGAGKIAAMKVQGGNAALDRLPAPADGGLEHAPFNGPPAAEPGSSSADANRELFDEIREVAESADADQVPFLTVLVDSKDGLSLFQSTLEQQAIRALTDDDDGSAGAKQIERIGPAKSDRDQALLVVADLEKIIRAYDQFRAREKEVTLRVEPPLDVAAFDEPTRQKLQKLAAEPAGGTDAASAPVVLPPAARAYHRDPAGSTQARIAGQDRAARGRGASLPAARPLKPAEQGAATGGRAKRRPVRMVIRVAKPQIEPELPEEQQEDPLRAAEPREEGGTAGKPPQ